MELAERNGDTTTVANRAKETCNTAETSESWGRHRMANTCGAQVKEQRHDNNRTRNLSGSPTHDAWEANLEQLAQQADEDAVAPVAAPTLGGNARKGWSGAVGPCC